MGRAEAQIAALADTGRPAKHKVYSDELIRDHALLPVDAACCREALSWVTHADPAKFWLAHSMQIM